ncbi:peptidyl-prolyl cis-trans isomerase [Acrasis kona]|uniref:Peptidyl-prolyl cis-trans isomerase n=1 Tax=Acrasis kona TaxID=1008807 RepID=A0AAW2YRE6_9EUKA
MIKRFALASVLLLLIIGEVLSETQAPEQFSCILEITRTELGKSENVTINIHRSWSPIGVDRFYTLIKEEKYYDDSGFFRVLPGFVVQFGIAADPAKSAKWKDLKIKDDKVAKSNVRGTISFATAGANTRTTQLFINYGNNSRLDGMGFAPFGEVSSEEDMKILDSIYSKYGQSPSQNEIYSEGNKYLKENYPKLDYIKHLSIKNTN